MKNLVASCALFWVLVGLTTGLQNCKKPDDPATPQPSVDEPKPEDKIRTGGVLLDTAQYKALPLFTDPLIGARKMAGKDPLLPASYDLTPNMPPVGNQGAQSSCVSWAAAYGLQSFYNKLARNTNFMDASGKRDDATVFSPAFVYNQVNGGRDQGSNFRNTLDLMQTQGVATLKDMPYKLEGGYFPNQQDYTLQPTDAQKQAAAAYKIKRWARASTTVASLKRFLYYDYPLAVMVAIDKNFDRPADKLSNGEFVWKTADSQTGRGFHGVVLVGYDDQLQAFKIQNSWGTAWANRGYIWLAYDLLPTVLKEAYIAIPGEGRSNLKPALFTTDDVTAIANGRATYGATITDFGDLPMVRYGFAVSSQTQTPTSNNPVLVTKTLTKAPFSFTISQTTSGTAITYMRPFAEALDGTVFYGATKSFQPIPIPPVATPVFGSSFLIYDVINTSAKMWNILSSAVAGSILQHGHVWSKTNQSPTIADSKTTLGVPKTTFPQTFTSMLDGLDASTAYYIRGYVTTTDGITTYSGSPGRSFTTVATNVSPDTPPSIETNAPTDVTSTSAQVSMQVLSAGGSNIRLDGYGILFNTDRTQTDASVGSNTLFGQSAFGKLSGSLTSLVPNTTYYVRAYAVYTLVNQTGGSAKVALGKVFTITTTGENLTGTWTKLPGETPYKLGSGSYLQTVGSLVYMAEPRTGKFYSYNPSNGEVTTLSPYATTNAASYQDEFDGFTIGTVPFMLYSDPSDPKLALFQAYSVSSKTWGVKAPFPGTARRSAVSMSINGKGYYGMGYTYVGGTASMLNDWWEYDPAANKWTQKAAPKPASRYSAASFDIGNKGYLGMGQTYSSTPLPSAEWWEYDPANDSWTKKTAPPVRAVNGILQTFGAAGRAFSPGNGKGYFFYDDEYVSIANRSIQVLEYDPATDKWTARSRFTGPFRKPGSSTGFGGQRGLLFGGSNTSATIDYKDIWSFTP